MQDLAATMQDPAATMQDPAASMQDPAASMQDPAEGTAREGWRCRVVVDAVGGWAGSGTLIETANAGRLFARFRCRHPAQPAVSAVKLASGDTPSAPSPTSRGTSDLGNEWPWQ